MKTLVYDNYSKFIAAAATIRNMRGKVESMEEEMDRLVQNIGKISESSERISGTLAAKREAIEQLSGVHQLLRKLQFLVQLPARLRHSIALQNYSEAVSYYSKTYGVLDRYRHFPSFSPIAVQVDQIISDLKSVLDSKLQYQADLSPADLAGTTRLLLDLQIPARPLRQRYVDIAWSLLLSSLRPAEESVKGSNVPSVAITTTVAPNAATKVAQLRTASAGAATVSHSKRTQALQQLTPVELVDKTATMLTESLNEICQKYGALFLTRHTDRAPTSQEMKDQSANLNALTHLIHAVLGRFVTLCDRSLLDLAQQQQEQVSGDAEPIIIACITASDKGLSAILSAFYEQMALATDAMLAKADDSVAKWLVSEPSLTQQERSAPQLQQPSHYLDGVIASLLRFYFKTAEDGLQAALETLLSKLSARSESALTSDLCTELLDGCFKNISTVLEHLFAAHLAPLVSAYNDGRLGSAKLFPSHLNGFIISLFHHLVSLLQSYSEHDPQEPRLRALLLLLCLTARRLRTDLRPLLQRLVCGSILRDQEADNLLALLDQFGTVSQHILTAYVQLEGIKLGHRIRIAVEATRWESLPEPSAVSSWVSDFTGELSAIRHVLSVVVPSATHQHVQQAHGAKQVQQDALDGLFAKKASFFGKVEFDQHSLISGIAKLALKSLLEAIRYQVLERHGYQQLQLDCSFLARGLADCVPEAQLAAIINEINIASKERALDSTPMDPVILSKIVSL